MGDPLQRDQPRDRTEPTRWWTRPGIWIAIGLTVTLLGLLLTPKLFGFAFLFLPFVWIGRGRRR